MNRNRSHELKRYNHCMRTITKVAMISAAALTLSSMGLAQERGQQHVGKPAPAFSMKTTTGATITSQSLRGKVVLLDFWATWCGPCKAASPFMQDLHKRYFDRGLRVIGANAGERTRGAEPAKKYASDHGYTYTFTVENDAYFKTIGTGGYPTFVLIDKQGIVRNVWVGYADSRQSTMENAIKALL